MIWKHQNDCLQWSSPNVQWVLLAIKDETQLWSLAGAKGLVRLIGGES